MINDTSKEFIRRHIGPSEEDMDKMLKYMNFLFTKKVMWGENE